MSSAGVPQSGLAGVLNLVRPDLAAEQMALQRRQAFAQSLLSQQPQYTGIGGAADNFGSKILGAFLQRNADKKNLDIAKEYRDALFNPQGGGMAPPPQAQGSPPLGSLPPQAIPPMPGQPNSGATAQALPPLGSMPQGGLPPPSQAAPMAAQGPLAPQQTMSQQPQGQRAQSLFDQAVPDVPGVDPRNKFALYASDPTSYMKAYYDRTGLTDAEKNAAEAYGRGSPQYNQVMQAVVTKSGTNNLTRGMSTGPDGKISYAPPPALAGYHYEQGPNGIVQVKTPFAGGIDPVQDVAESQAAGKAEFSPKTGYVKDPATGKWGPVATNAAVMSGHSDPNVPLGIRSNNPGNLQPGGQEAQYRVPTAGILAASTNLDNYAKNGVNTLSGIISKWAPPTDANGKQINDTAGYIADIAKRTGLPTNQPLNLSDPNVKGSLLEAMFQHENANKFTAPNVQNSGQQAPSAPLPELPPSVKAASETFGKGVGDTAHTEYDQVHAMSADVPTRLNVLQSVLNLSHNGAPTGSAEWMNDARQTAAALTQALGHPVDANNPAALMGEIHKYMGQYSNRMAQGQGGTGTDKQLEAVEAANPNSTMFASTLQRVVPWIMANERGIAAKSNFLDASGTQDAQGQLKAQSDWRNLYSPRIAQFEMMNPQQQAGYLHDPKAFKDANDRQTFIQNAIKLHPFFGGPGQ